MNLKRWLRWPRSLSGRLCLILLVGLLAAQALSFYLVFYERTQSSMVVMLRFLSKDVASSVAILERLPAIERAGWLEKLERRNYRYRLQPGGPGEPIRSEVAAHVASSLVEALAATYSVRASAPVKGNASAQLQLQLHDGTPLTIDLFLSVLPPAPWMLLAFTAQLLSLVLISWLAVRWVTRPLGQLARAADALGPDFKSAPLPNDGPEEVAQAARAFNAMRLRIAAHLAERMQILAAISHDLQTPLTRMRLRADLLDDLALKEKLYDDLNAMQTLVQEGIAFARDGQGTTEPPCRTDLDALLESLVYDYADAGKAVGLVGRCECRDLLTRPHALRRILTNLLDNALKFGKEAEIQVACGADAVSIAVRDSGPGIPAGELQAVLQPFYRVEGSRNRATGGTGLGLAIAQQLTQTLGGVLSLANRDSGGLEVRLDLPTSQARQAAG